MTSLEARDMLSFPANGDNDTDTIINGVHFNTTALTHFNYTLYSNNTLSNVSKCYLVFSQYRPAMLSNGTFINGTSCYMPVLPLRTRGALGIAFGSAFAISIMFTLVSLNKHGRLHIREDRRFRVIGRRWQWYWMLFTAACGTISCLTSVDVDRDYLQDIALVLQGFFYHLMVPAGLAVVWEAVRHWGSWQERQIVDEDPAMLDRGGGGRRRETVEFWLPLVFYLFAWLNFFLVIPRSWSPIEKQHDAQQQWAIAASAATDSRFRAGSIMAACALATICASLSHSLKHYKPGKRGMLGGLDRLLREAPVKLLLSILLLGARTGYGIVSSWRFDLSILKYDVQVGLPYGLGYGPVFLIIVVLNIAGYAEENEDIRLLRQRRVRGRLLDAELGLTKKPKWWKRVRHESYMTDEQRLHALAMEVDQAAISRARAEQTNVELTDATELRERSRGSQPGDPFSDDAAAPPAGRPVRSMLDLDERPQWDRNGSRSGSVMTGSTLSGGRQPQKVRSMLDV